MHQCIKVNEAVAYQSEAMESRDHFKNGATLKSHTTRGNLKTNLS